MAPADRGTVELAEDVLEILEVVRKGIENEEIQGVPCHTSVPPSRLTRSTCAAAAVAARARRLNRLLAQAALVPHRQPAAGSHQVLVM
jgi:hypothetical protein